MKYKQTATRVARTALALGATAVTVTSFTGATNAEDGEPAKRQQPVSPAPASIATDNANFSYWTGEYWDAQKGSSFWHNLLPDRSAASNQIENNTANGSKRVRDLRRARADAAAKSQR